MQPFVSEAARAHEDPMSKDEKSLPEQAASPEAASSPEARKLLSRRNMLKAAGIGVVGGAVLYGMDALRLFPERTTRLPDPPTDKMTYRTNPGN